MILSIDPDIHKSGTCYKIGETWIMRSMTLSDLIHFIHQYEVKEVLIETTWKAKRTVWHKHKEAHKGKNIGSDAGMNRGYGKAIIDVLQHFGIKVTERQPMQKGIFKQKGSWTPKGREIFHNNWPYLPKKTNDDCRDAALLIISHFNYHERNKI